MFLPLLLTATGLGHTSILPTERLAKEAFGLDAPWFNRNIPFFKCADLHIHKTYDYRWGVYKAHIQGESEPGTVTTEFLDDVGWWKGPFDFWNDATPFHIRTEALTRLVNLRNEYHQTASRETDFLLRLDRPLQLAATAH